MIDSMPEWIVKYWVEWVFTLVLGGLTIAVKRLSTKVKEDRRQRKAQADGVKALLRDRIIQSHSHNLERGYCTIYEKESIQGMYDAYTALGGNGMVSGLVDTINKLQTTHKEV